MGYNITVGQAEIFYDKEDLFIRLGAEFAEQEAAPDHDKHTLKGNSRSPGYIAWHEFCKDAGITKLFYGQGWSMDARSYLPCSDAFHRETPLLRDHPGAQPIGPKDLAYIRAARKTREETNGGRPPGFWEDDGVDNGKDPTLARLLWLEFWFDWAIKNCSMPVVANS